MTEARKIRRNSLFSFLSAAIRLGANMLMFVGVARFYGPEAFGHFTLAHTYVSICFLLADFGLDTLLITEVSRSRSLEFMQRVFSLKTVSTGVSVAVVCLVAAISDISHETQLLLFVLSVSIVGNSFASFCFSVFKGREEFHHESFVSFAQNVFLLFALFVLGYVKAPILLVAFVFVASRIIGFGLAVKRMKRILPAFSFHFSLHDWRGTLREATPFGLRLIFGSLFLQLDTLLLSIIKGEDSVGEYQAAMKLLVLALVIPDVIVQALLPVFSRLHMEDRSKRDRLAQTVGKTLIYLGFPVAFLFVFSGQYIIEMVYGLGAFPRAGIILQIFGGVLFIRFTSETYVLILTSSNHQRTVSAIITCMTAASCLLNFLVIPIYGAVGAASVSILTNGIAGLWYASAGHRQVISLQQLMDRRQFFTISGSIVVVVLLFVTGLTVYHFWTFLVAALLPIMYYYAGYSAEERNLAFAIRR